MPSPVQQPVSHRSIHLLRALLREASYLPDASARQYFHGYILQRFRAYQPAQNASVARAKRRKISIIQERTRAMQWRAKKGLNLLRRANQGELPCLEKVLMFTYGRMGPRKYRLTEELLQPDVHTEDAVDPRTEPSPLQRIYYSNKRFLSFFGAPQKASKQAHTIDFLDRYSRLKTAVKAQQQKGISIHREMRRSNLLTPICNIWERPMPIKRARNNVKKWYAETMRKLLPPLPAEEWDRLEALATRKQRCAFVPRRTLGTVVNFPLEQDEVRFTSMVDAALALDKQSKADRPFGKQRPHNLTSSYMTRIYGKVFGLCSKLEWSDQRRKWTAVWGKLPLNNRPYGLPVDDVLFAGVGTDGRALNPKAHGSKTIHSTHTT